MKANRIAPGGTPRFVASHLRLFCLSMSHKKDVRLILVNMLIPFTRKNTKTDYTENYNCYDENCHIGTNGRVTIRVKK